MSALFLWLGSVLKLTGFPAFSIGDQADRFPFMGFYLFPDQTGTKIVFCLFFLTEWYVFRLTGFSFLLSAVIIGINFSDHLKPTKCYFQKKTVISDFVFNVE